MKSQGKCLIQLFFCILESLLSNLQNVHLFTASSLDAHDEVYARVFPTAESLLDFFKLQGERNITYCLAQEMHNNLMLRSGIDFFLNFQGLASEEFRRTSGGKRLSEIARQDHADTLKYMNHRAVHISCLIVLWHFLLVLYSGYLRNIYNAPLNHHIYAYLWQR